MTTLRWPDGRGRFIDRDSDRTPGDIDVLDIGPGTTIDVADQETVDAYLDRGFVQVDGGTDGSDGFDVAAFLDRTPVADVRDDIRDGAADGHLDAVAAAAERATVETAVENRRDDIGEE